MRVVSSGEGGGGLGALSHPLPIISPHMPHLRTLAPPDLSLRQASASYEAMRFREAIKFAYFGMQEARDRYRSGTAQVGIKENLLRQWAEYQALVMVPITPHWSEALWEVLGHEGCAVSARWPTPPKAEDAMISAAGGYLFDVSHQLAAQVPYIDVCIQRPAYYRSHPPSPLTPTPPWTPPSISPLPPLDPPSTHPPPPAPPPDDGG